MTIDHTAGSTAVTSPELTETFDLVVRALSTTLEKPLPGVTLQTSLFHEIGLDSTGVLDLLMNLEEEAGIEIDMEDLDMRDFASVGNLVELVRARKDA